MEPRSAKTYGQQGTGVQSGLVEERGHSTGVEGQKAGVLLLKGTRSGPDKIREVPPDLLFCPAEPVGTAQPGEETQNRNVQRGQSLKFLNRARPYEWIRSMISVIFHFYCLICL